MSQFGTGPYSIFLSRLLHDISRCAKDRTYNYTYKCWCSKCCLRTLRMVSPSIAARRSALVTCRALSFTIRRARRSYTQVCSSSKVRASPALLPVTEPRRLGPSRTVPLPRLPVLTRIVLRRLDRRLLRLRLCFRSLLQRQLRIKVVCALIRVVLKFSLRGGWDFEKGASLKVELCVNGVVSGSREWW